MIPQSQTDIGAATVDMAPSVFAYHATENVSVLLLEALMTPDGVQFHERNGELYLQLPGRL